MCGVDIAVGNNAAYIGYEQARRSNLQQRINEARSSQQFEIKDKKQ